jgi:4-hydroxybenzoate polyprenyltransferase
MSDKPSAEVRISKLNMEEALGYLRIVKTLDRTFNITGVLCILALLFMQPPWPIIIVGAIIIFVMANLSCSAGLVINLIYDRIDELDK